MRLTNDFYIVLIEKLFESSTTESGIITLNDAIVKEETEERMQYKRRYGKVLEVPLSFSDGHVDMIDPGAPAPRKFVSHDDIEMLRNLWGRMTGYVAYDSKAYYPSTFERYECVTCADVARKVDVKVGDKIYFSEVATEEDRFLGKFQGGLMYAVRVDEVQAVVRDVPLFDGYGKKKAPKIFMQGGWVLAKVDMETWEEISINIPGSPIPLVMKAAPEAKPLRAFIEAVSHRPDLKRGDHIIFERNADAPVLFEGEEMVIIKDEDVLAKIV